MKNRILEALFDASLRMDECIFLAGALAAGGELPDSLTSFFEDQDYAAIEAILGKMPSGIEFDDEEAISEWLILGQKHGFLVQFATPVMRPISKGSRTYSWGYIQTHWVYADTIPDAVEKGLLWATEVRAREDAKAAREGGAS